MGENVVNNVPKKHTNRHDYLVIHLRDMFKKHYIEEPNEYEKEDYERVS